MGGEWQQYLIEKKVDAGGDETLSVDHTASVQQSGDDLVGSQSAYYVDFDFSFNIANTNVHTGFEPLDRALDFVVDLFTPIFEGLDMMLDFVEIGFNVVLDAIFEVVITLYDSTIDTIHQITNLTEYLTEQFLSFSSEMGSFAVEVLDFISPTNLVKNVMTAFSQLEIAYGTN